MVWPVWLVRRWPRVIRPDQVLAVWTDHSDHGWQSWPALSFYYWCDSLLSAIAPRSATGRTDPVSTAEYSLPIDSLESIVPHKPLPRSLDNVLTMACAVQSRGVFWHVSAVVWYLERLVTHYKFPVTRKIDRSSISFDNSGSRKILEEYNDWQYHAPFQ